MSLTIPSSDWPSDDLLIEWRWRLGVEARLVELSLAGDAAVLLADQSVGWLDAGAGSLDTVAPSLREYWAVRQDPERSEELLLAPVVQAWIAQHGQLPKAYCLSFRTLPVFGGQYSIENRVPVPVAEHLGFCGQLHRKIDDLPDGARVEIRTIP